MMSRQPRIQAVAFDLDGLMFNTEDLYDEVTELVLQKRGHRFTRQLKLDMMGLPSLQAIDVMRRQCGLAESCEGLLAELHRGMTERLPERLVCLPGLVELLDLLELRRIPRSIATSSSRAFAEQCLRVSGLGGRFSFLLTAEDVTRGKPHPDIYLDSAKRHRVEPATMLVLEDSLTGSKAAVAAGAFTVAVPGHHSRDQYFGHVDRVAESLADDAVRSLFDEATT